MGRTQGIPSKGLLKPTGQPCLESHTRRLGVTHFLSHQKNKLRVLFVRHVWKSLSGHMEISSATSLPVSFLVIAPFPLPTLSWHGGASNHPYPLRTLVGGQHRKQVFALMNPTPSNLSTNRAPPSTGYLAGVLPHSGQTATSIATRGARKIRKWAVEVGNVVRAHVYMDSIFFAADAQCRLVNPDNLADERSLYEHDILVCLGERPEPKIRPCVVVGVVKEADEKPHYLLCPMATFSHQSYNKLEAPASLLVRPVETTYHNEPFGAYTPYRFDPEWDKGPQYLFPIQVSRTNDYITDHWLKQTIKNGSLEQLRKDIEEVSNVWKKWRHAEHVDVVSDADRQWLAPANICVIKPLFSSIVQIRLGQTKRERPVYDAVEGEVQYYQFE